MNVKAFSEFVTAGEAYLKANGWVKIDSKWKVPPQFGVYAGNIYMHWHAIETQYQYDSNQLREKR